MREHLDRLSTFGSGFVLTLVVDQVTKAWAWSTVRDTGGLQPIPGVLHFEFALNSGAAFGLGAGHPASRAILIGLGVVAVVAMAWAALRIRPPATLARIGLGLAAGGALGNVLDRLVRVTDTPHRLGTDLRLEHLIEHAQAIQDAARFQSHWVQLPEYGVVDFLVVFYAPGRRWPAFNVADVALSIGGALLLFWLARRDDPAADAEAET